MRKPHTNQSKRCQPNQTMASVGQRYVPLADDAMPDMEPDRIDGSPAAMRAFLIELAELSGQPAAAGADGVLEPVVELLLGEITTIATLVEHPAPELCISAVLPLQQGAAQPDASAAMRAAASGCEYLWHADQGRAVLLRRVPLARLADEPSVMDAMLDTADVARAIVAAANRY